MLGRRRKQRTNRPAIGFGLLKTALLALSVGFGHVTCSRPAFAQNAGDGAAAQALFDNGRAIMAKGDYSAACPKLEESQRLDPGSGTLFHLADCYEHQRRISSVDDVTRAGATARATGNADRSRQSKQRAAALETRLSRIVVRVMAEKKARARLRDTSRTIPEIQIRERLGRAGWVPREMAENLTDTIDQYFACFGAMLEVVAGRPTIAT
jgi:hypothetical protein